jgi:hypothetical protein
MSYQSVVAMAGSQSLKARMVAAAAENGLTAPLQWVEQNIWQICATDGWSASWDFARDNMTINANPDIGMRDDVINDQMISAGVAALIAEQATG